jgi:hypothetical protein
MPVLGIIHGRQQGKGIDRCWRAKAFVWMGEEKGDGVGVECGIWSDDIIEK